jgi:hypothetical protein
MTLLKSNAFCLTGDLILEDMYLYSNEINENILLYWLSVSVLLRF